jgi:MFS family permease
MKATASPRQHQRYRRDIFTWLAFAGLFTIGFFQATLGPALLYVHSAEHTSYLSAALLQAAFAVGGGVAGLSSAAGLPTGHRAVVIRAGLAGMAIAGVGFGYAGIYPLTIITAFLMSLLGTSATIRIWAALADQNLGNRAIAMTEGEVSVSTGGIIAPFAISVAAATMLGWSSAFLLGTVVVAATILASLAIPIPADPLPADPIPADPLPAETVATVDKKPRTSLRGRGRGLPPTLIVVFAVVALEWSLNFWLASYLHDDIHAGRGLAASMVSVLYAANLAGRLAASRLARHMTTRRLLALCLAVSFCGLPPLLAASGPVLASAAVVVTGLGIGGTFPLASSLHVSASLGSSTSAVGRVMAAASLGQLAGPLVVGVISNVTSLRVGLIALPALTLLAIATLGR